MAQFDKNSFFSNSLYAIDNNDIPLLDEDFDEQFMPRSVNFTERNDFFAFEKNN